MKNLFMILIASVSLPLCSAFAAAPPAMPAPAFEVKDAAGKTHKLSDYAGRWVILEWYNKDCPYVKKHYDSGNMQKLQEELTAKKAPSMAAKDKKKAAGKEVAWLTVISSAPGKQGYLSPAEALKQQETVKSKADGILIDADGKMGKAYDAKTTPHMFVINPKGQVVYAGAIDDNDSADPAVIAKSVNYVRRALDEAMNGKPITTASSRAYGCSVKY